MGCEHANVSGDPTAEGKPFVLRIRCPDGAKVPPHWQPTDENITVLKGNFMIGTGEVFDLQSYSDGRRKFHLYAKNHAALCIVQRRHSPPGPRDRAVQDRLVESSRPCSNESGSG